MNYHCNIIMIRSKLLGHWKEYFSKTVLSKGSFTNTINVTVFVSGTFDLFDVMYKQHHMIVLNPF